MKSPQDTFEAFDEFGQRYTVHVHPPAGPGDKVGELRLTDGRRVRRHSQGMYSIEATDVRLTTEDRRAP